jgi:low temperature requirement protein LtrA
MPKDGWAALFGFGKSICLREQNDTTSDHSIRNGAERKYEVTPLELFFDLVFAFAISQLSQHLLTHLSW